MIKLALIGKNITHSKSKVVYESLLKEEISYTLIDIKNEKELPSLEELRKFDGVSITSPYKEFYLNLTKPSSFSLELRAINALCFFENEVHSTNTDYLAAKVILKNEFFDKLSRDIILLGNGPMARVIKKILKDLDISFTQVSRSLYNFDSFKQDPQKSPVFVINALSRGVSLPLSTDEDDFIWDLNYANDIVKKNVSKKSTYQDGEKLLLLQAKFALSFWKIKDLL